MTTLIGADEAVRLLGVTKPTLYAYVSRGLIDRRTAVDGRTSLYRRDQVEALASRGRRRSVPERPSIDVRIASSITELSDDGPAYRGRDVAGLARSYGYEQVAELLWSGDLPARRPVWPIDVDDRERCLAVVSGAGTGDALAVLALSAQTLAARHDGHATESAADAARRLLAVAPSALGGPDEGSIAARFTAAFVRDPSPELVAAVDTALVLLADHELATSTLAVRVACSVRAAPSAAFAAGLAVVGGRLHGGASRAVATMIDEVLTDGAPAVVSAYLEVRRLPGFGHTVYRQGDPRVGPLLDAVRGLPDARASIEAVDAVIAEAGRRIGHLPNVDLALGALLHAGGFPVDAPLFGLARIAGWAAHYDEESAERPLRYRGLTRLR